MPLRIYLIGAGVISRTHAKAISELNVGDDVELSVADTNTKALQDFSKEFPHARLFEDVPSMLEEPAQPDDIVVVATPPFTHFKLACAALHTKRHVLCEKPLAVSQEQAEEMLELARSQDRFIGCCSDRFIGTPATEKVKQLIQSDQLGNLYHVTFIHRGQRGRPGIEYQPNSKWFLNHQQSGGGVVMDWGPYDFATLNDLLSPVKIEVLSAWLETPETDLQLPENTVFDVETHAGAQLLYYLSNGSTVSVNYERSSCTHGSERSIAEIEGLKGAVNWDWQSWEGPGKVDYTFDKNGILESDQHIAKSETTIHAMDRPLIYFYWKTQGKPSPAIVNEQAVFNFSCIQAIYECVATGRPQTVDLNSFHKASF
ncbi:Gfo/Idh/MocA family protein [Fictibacillus terranigra]|uniref:Gfo/Idh/MocA family oxidoreductase n=1 Tax=Fictibacillus terranigra TaxID=3058424 RepID=A0ABT8EDJ6_9BACL|nr:Gfo/Idh/MocA family oxidoreductase [Fictibacillus sp. CENA-BCM004]MDN4076006.1 Gfo/Idh/MocA family oxidoreductase [Fictibacillus sp. CENA-BCM004]